jgi:hypothetical protein
LGQQFYGTARALINYSYTNRFLVRILIEAVLGQVVGTAFPLGLLSDLCHTSLDMLPDGSVRHRRGVQQGHGFGSPDFTGYSALGLGPPTLVGGSRETSSFLFASQRLQVQSYCPHGSESLELKWYRPGLKSDLATTLLKQWAEDARYDTVPVLREATLECSYLNTLYVARQVENAGDLGLVCRLVPKLNLQVHGGGALPLIPGSVLQWHGGSL